MLNVFSGKKNSPHKVELGSGNTYTQVNLREGEVFPTLSFAYRYQSSKALFIRS